MNNHIIGKLLFTLPVANELGEGVQWHHQRQEIWWIDIEGCCLYQYQTKTQELKSFNTPYRIGCFAFIENTEQHSNLTKSTLIVAFEQGIAFYDYLTSKVNWIAKPESHLNGHRFNDGRVDKEGRFWAGTMLENNAISTEHAALYMIDNHGHCQKKIDDLLISNGVCWQPSGNFMYHADSPKNEIYRYDFSHSGTLSNKTLFVKTPKFSSPDGATVDADNKLWSAHWGGAQVVRYDHLGNIDVSFDLPVNQPTCVCIGGPNLDWLIVTSAKTSLTAEQLKNEPLAGHVFVYQLHGVKGVEENQFNYCPQS